MRYVVVTVVLLGSLSIADQAAAEEAASSETPPPTLVGTWDYSKNLDHGRQIVRGAFDEAIKQLSVFYRGIARRKLQSSDPLVRTIIISKPGGRIGMKLIGEKTGEFATRPGVTEKITGPNGKQADCTQTFSKNDSVLDQVFTGEKGSTRNRYSLSTDGQRMTYRTNIKGQKLESPIRFQLVYRRRAP